MRVVLLQVFGQFFNVRRRAYGSGMNFLEASFEEAGKDFAGAQFVNVGDRPVVLIIHGFSPAYGASDLFDQTFDNFLFVADGFCQNV